MRPLFRLKLTNEVDATIVDKSQGINQTQTPFQRVHLGMDQPLRVHNIMNFRRKDDCAFFVFVLKKCLVPFIRDMSPNGHWFVQDSNLKLYTKVYVLTGGSLLPNHWNWTPSKPLAWIESVRREVVPRSKLELMDRIRAVWRTLRVANGSDMLDTWRQWCQQTFSVTEEQQGIDLKLYSLYYCYAKPVLLYPCMTYVAM